MKNSNLEIFLLDCNWIEAKKLLYHETISGEFLIELSKKGNKKIIKWLYNQGLNLNVYLSSGDTLLNVAIRYNQEKLVLWLLEKEIEIDNNCLSAAILSDNLYLTSIFLEKTNIDKKEELLKLVLSKEMMNFLIKNGFDTDYDYLISLKPWIHVEYHLSKNSFYDDLLIYLNKEISLNKLNRYRRLTKILKEVPFNEKLLSCNDSEFIIDVYHLENSIVNKFLDLDKKITLLMIACYNGDIEIVRRVCKTTLDINCQDINGNNCLNFSSCSDNHEKIKEILIEAGISTTNEI